MGRTVRLSYEEKRQKLEEYLHETKEVYTLKQLEKLAHKHKGIVSQSVKEVLQSLVDDDLVDQDKIGTSNFFWAFPSQALIRRKNKLADVNEQLAARRKKLEDLRARRAAVEGKEDTAERREKLKRVAELEEAQSLLKKERAKYAKLHPDTIALQKKHSAMALEAANRWTDNVLALRSHCRDKFNLEVDKFNQHFGVPAEFDYVE